MPARMARFPVKQLGFPLNRHYGIPVASGQVDVTGVAAVNVSNKKTPAMAAGVVEHVVSLPLLTRCTRYRRWHRVGIPRRYRSGKELAVAMPDRR